MKTPSELPRDDHPLLQGLIAFIEKRLRAADRVEIQVDEKLNTRELVEMAAREARRAGWDVSFEGERLVICRRD
jgi:hypothetical protein